jgi:hypothetical protein
MNPGKPEPGHWPGTESALPAVDTVALYLPASSASDVRFQIISHSACSAVRISIESGVRKPKSA